MIRPLVLRDIILVIIFFFLNYHINLPVKIMLVYRYRIAVMIKYSNWTAEKTRQNLINAVVQSLLHSNGCAYLGTGPVIIIHITNWPWGQLS